MMTTEEGYKMTRNLSLALLCAAVVCMVLPRGVSAHHSTAAEFDTKKPITFTGTIKKVQWMNPHIYTLVEAKNADGVIVVYSVEGSAPNSLFRQGWRMDSLKIGTMVTVSGLRSKNEASFRVGQAKITTADGTRIFAGPAPGHVAAE